MGTLHWLFSTKTGTLPPLNGYITGKKAICDNGLLSLKYLNGCFLKETTTHKKSAQKGIVVVFLNFIPQSLCALLCVGMTSANCIEILGTVYGMDRLFEEDMFVDYIEILLARTLRTQKAKEFNILNTEFPNFTTKKGGTVPCTVPRNSLFFMERRSIRGHVPTHRAWER